MRFLTKKIGSYSLISLFFLLLVFSVYQTLFLSYFESDEWVHLTYYFPLTQRPDGFWQAIWGTMYHTGALSQGMHVIPIAWGLFYLDTLLFGMNFAPYAGITLFLHATNSFLVFCLLQLFLLTKDSKLRRWSASYLAPLVAGVFFALSPTPIHAITGAAPFYGQNVLSVTFLLLCLLAFKGAFLTKKKKYLLLTILFLFLAVLSKETTAFLFLLLPIIAFIETRAFSFRFLAKGYLLIVILFIFLRFALPQIAVALDQHLPQSAMSENSSQTENVTAITNTDLSIHENLPGEILFRTTTYPIRMLSQVFFSRPTITALVEQVVLFVYPKPGDEDSLRSQNRLAFSTGPANDFLIYFLSICLIGLLIVAFAQAKKQQEKEKVRSLILGVAVILLSTLPLVAIIFSFPRWGYDTYFDSRHYYAPTVGGAILFPFLLITFGGIISRALRPLIRFGIPSVLIASLGFYLWVQNALFVISDSMEGIVEKTGKPRREIITQLQQHLPSLPKKIVFHIETDGLGAYGTKLPFQTSIPQMLSLIYYETSPLPETFYTKPILEGMSTGYQESEGRGLGYYDSKLSVADALLEKKFSIDDIYSYYHHSQSNTIEDKTNIVREELRKYLEETKDTVQWHQYRDASSSAKLEFRYPSDLSITESTPELTEVPLVKRITFSNLGDIVTFHVLTIPPTFDLAQFILVDKVANAKEAEEKEVLFDRYHKNMTVVLSQGKRKHYYLRFPTLLIIATIENATDEDLKTLEKVLGSVKELN